MGVCYHGEQDIDNLVVGDGGSHVGGGFSPFWEIGKRFAGHSQSTPHSGGGESCSDEQNKRSHGNLANTSPLRWGFLG